MMAEGPDRRNPDDRGHRPRRPRGRKNTKRWCRGKPGVEHQPIIALSNFARSYRPWCGPAPEWSKKVFGKEWICRHQEQCAKCGKVLRRMISDDECPEIQGGAR